MKPFHQWKAITLAICMMTTVPCFADSSQNVGAAVKDTWITTQVKSNLAANTVTHAATIGVETNNGVVSLSGTVASNTEAETAVKIAESLPDVKDVDASNLTVANSNQPLTDTYITAKVKGIFIKNNIMGEGKNVPVTDIKVETQQGVVYLSGTVRQPSEIQQAIDLAKSIDGVTNVVSSLRTEKSA